MRRYFRKRTDRNWHKKIGLVLPINAFKMTVLKACEIMVATAAPMAENLGMRIRFSRIFMIAPTTVLNRESRVRFSVRSHGPWATPKKTNSDAQMCTARIGPERA
jgi:hypothetical protein